MEKTQLAQKETYQIDEVVDFKIKAVFTNYCEVIDEKTGITSYLQSTAKLMLFKGQKVECRIIAVNEKHPKIELVNIKAFEQGEVSLSEEKLNLGVYRAPVQQQHKQNGKNQKKKNKKKY